MGDKFLKFKRRAKMLRLMRSLLTALATGTAITGLLRLLVRFEIVAMHPTIPIGAGLFAAAAVGCALFFVLPLSDTRLAKMLDEELSLSERVETMLEYMGEESAMLSLQREDANAALSEAPLETLRLKRVWIYITAVLLGALVLTSSFIFSKAPEPPPVVDEEEFALTDLQAKAIEQLIDDVEASDMASPYKENTVELISTLLEVLRVTETVRDKDAAVLLAMNGILGEVDASSFAVEIMGELWATELPTLRMLAKALNYYDWPKIDEWDKFHSELNSFRDTLVYEEPTDNGAAPAEATDSEVSETELLLLKAASGITGVLDKSGASASDALRSALYRLALAEEENEDGTRVYGLQRLSIMISASGCEATQREIDATLTALESALYSALLENKINTGTGEGAIDRLASILDCEKPRFERPVFTDTTGGQVIPDDEIGTGGAIGGGTEYGSDDLVLDPYTNTYVEYGKILDRYYSEMLGSVENGEYTEAERKALEKYFTILYGGFEKGE